jgi:hypothetical protein
LIEWRRIVLAGVLCLVLAAALAQAIPVLFGAPLAAVHVSWRFLGSAERVELEQRFRLTEGAHLDGDRWVYVPADTTPARLEEIVRHPKVARTVGIDRSRLQMAADGPLTARRGGVFAGAPRLAARALKLLVYALASIGGALLLLGGAEWRGWSPQTALRRAHAQWPRDRRSRDALAAGVRSTLERGIPVAPAEAAGLFRIVFGSVVLVYLLRNPVYPELHTPAALESAAGPYGVVVRWLAGHAAVVQSLGSWLAALGLLVIAGAATTVTYAAFVGAFLLWASVSTLGTSHHVVSVLAIALVCLLPARWGDAWSVDAWRRRRTQGASHPSKAYGYAIWAPMFVLGVAFAMAAGSKVRHGFEWVLNGTVKYHFVSDLESAWVPWGVWLTRSHAAAVALSALAVIVEALVITAAFSRSDRYRLLVGLGTACLLGGFAAFQGVVWLGWWILLLGFLPWHRIPRASPAAAGSTSPLETSLAQRALVGGVVLLHLVVWTAQFEARPMLSAYDMYATTYDDDEAYELASDLTYRLFGLTSGGALDDLHCTLDDAAVRVVAGAASGGVGERGRLREILEPCVSDRREIRSVMLQGDREAFNWETGRFEWKRRIDQIGPLALDWLWDGGSR